MRNRLLLCTMLLLVAVVLGACGATPAPTSAPAGPVVLEVKGKVSSELKLTMADVQALGMQKISAEHPKKGMQDYEGVFLNAVLDKAGLAGDATTATLTASDGFTADVPVADIKACANCLVAVEGEELNLVMPGMSSKAWVKTVVTIEIK